MIMFPSLCGITSITYSSLETLCVLLFLFQADRDHIKALSVPGPSSKPRLCCSERQEWNNDVMWDSPNIVNTLPCKETEYINTLSRSEHSTQLKYCNIGRSHTLHVSGKMHPESPMGCQAQNINTPGYYLRKNLDKEVEDVGMKKRINVKDMYDDDGYIAADVQSQITSKAMYQESMQNFGDGMYDDECGYKVMGTRSKKVIICMGTEGQTANVVTNPAIIPHNDDCYDSVQIHKAWQ